MFGTSLAIVEELESLNRPQRAFLATIRRLAETRGKRPIPSPELLDFVREEHGHIFNEGQVKSRIYTPLANFGWIVHDAPTGGRGGKGGTVAATDGLLALDYELLTGLKPGDLPADIRGALTRPLEEIYRDLKSTDKHTKGIALELLAVNLATDLGLAPLRLRVRGIHTGGAEVDLVAEGAHLHFTRWLFQCKNTASVDVGVLAKEVGMATLLQAHVIVIATTGSMSRVVRAYANRVGETTPFQVVLVDRDVLARYELGGALSLRSGFRRDAASAMQAKRPQIIATLDELSEDES